MALVTLNESPNKTESDEYGKGPDDFKLAKQCCFPNRKLVTRFSEGGHSVERGEEDILALQAASQGCPSTSSELAGVGIKYTGF